MSEWLRNAIDRLLIDSTRVSNWLTPSVGGLNQYKQTHTHTWSQVSTSCLPTCWILCVSKKDLNFNESYNDGIGSFKMTQNHTHWLNHTWGFVLSNHTPWSCPKTSFACFREEFWIKFWDNLKLTRFLNGDGMKELRLTLSHRQTHVGHLANNRIGRQEKIITLYSVRKKIWMKNVKCPKGVPFKMMMMMQSRKFNFFSCSSISILSHNGDWWCNFSFFGSSE